MFKIYSYQNVHRFKMATNIEYWFSIHSKRHFWAFFGSKIWFTLSKWFQMWSIRVDSESNHSCSHSDTKIEVVTIKNIRVRFFSMPSTQSVLHLDSIWIQKHIFKRYWPKMISRRKGQSPCIWLTEIILHNPGLKGLWHFAFLCRTNSW